MGDKCLGARMNAWREGRLVVFDIGAPTMRQKNILKKEVLTKNTDAPLSARSKIHTLHVAVHLLLLSFEESLGVDELISTQRTNSQRAGGRKCIYCRRRLYVS
jgi:hypothetical protein